MENIGGLETFAGLLVLVTIAFIFVATSRVGVGVVNTWRVIALTLEALVKVPWGLFLIAIGVGIAVNLADLFGCVAGVVFIYFGGSYLFSAVEGYVKISRNSKLNR